MSKDPSRPNRKTDRTAAVTLEVPTGVADDIEAVLRGFAEEAELDTSLVVDHSGFLIAGISSIPDVDVDTIGSLVAGASGATEGLTGALGEDGKVESLHLGEDRLLYLKEVGERFILVGVSDSNIPAGILRDQATQIEGTLLKHLKKVKAVPMSLTKKKDQPKPEPTPAPEPPKSLRQETPKPAPAPAPKPEPTPVAVQPAAAPAVTKSVGKVVGAIGAGTPAAKKAAPAPAPATKTVTAKRPTLPKKEDVIPDTVFEVDEDSDENSKSGFAAEVSSNKPAEKPPAAKKVSPPTAIVENSPFEMDEDDEAETNSNFQSPRRNTTPVHLSVPAARQREAEAREEQENDQDRKSGPRYSFELG